MSKVMELLEENKKTVIAISILAIGMVVYMALGGNPTITSGGAVDASKAVTTSQDKIDNGAVKIGNVEGGIGSLDMSKKDDHSNTNTKTSTKKGGDNTSNMATQEGNDSK